MPFDYANNGFASCFGFIRAIREIRGCIRLFDCDCKRRIGGELNHGSRHGDFSGCVVDVHVVVARIGGHRINIVIRAADVELLDYSDGGANADARGVTRCGDRGAIPFAALDAVVR